MAEEEKFSMDEKEKAIVRLVLVVSSLVAIQNIAGGIREKPKAISPPTPRIIDPQSPFPYFEKQRRRGNSF